MTVSRSGVRRRRSTLTVAVTGAAGPLGSALVDRLTQDPNAPKVVGLDTTKRPSTRGPWRIADIRDPALASRLTGVDTLVHLATDRSPGTPQEDRRAVNVRGTEVLLDAAVAAGVRRVVILTSAMVYGADPSHPVPLDEDAPVISELPDGLVGDWVGMERAALRRAAAGALEVTVVRPASLVGTVTDALLPGLFEAVRLLGIRDARCHWQFCHVDDLLDALAAAALGAVSGAVTVGCEGWLTRAEVEAIAGMRSVVLPAAVATATAERLHRIGALNSPASEIQYLINPWVVGSQRLRATGWQPRWTNDAVLREHLRALGDRAGRGLVVLDRKDATRAAAGAAAGAGATLAVIGSLALARARRRR
ncbi:MAG: NAD-dependent epimerase/dehydratase family protein [Frankiaceae bacterium]|nr:NAD-dependent epimerase/dehydratase family protein [Frankiaceae bacterium]MBV9872202.1 NAD-dependent epimerase/dehydratase family protein [Frankiaceae bacterium]